MKMAVNAASFPDEPFITSPYSEITGGYYSMAVDPVSSDVYVSDAVDNVQPGNIYRYLSSGEPVDAFPAGIIPCGFCFRP